MAEPNVCLLKPSEYRGEPGTAVAGRVVIRRMLTFKPKAGKSQQKGKAKGETIKVEFHISGSDSVADVLYVEAWGETARNVYSAWSTGQCLMIQNAEVIPSEPKFSTSRLPYYLKIKHPIGVRTIIREVTTDPWIELPLLHPLQPLKALTRVEHQQQVCVSVLLVERRDPVSRETATGPATVCNSLRLARHRGLPADVPGGCEAS